MVQSRLAVLVVSFAQIHWVPYAAAGEGRTPGLGRAVVGKTDDGLAWTYCRAACAVAADAREASVRSDSVSALETGLDCAKAGAGMLSGMTSFDSQACEAR